MYGLGTELHTKEDFSNPHKDKLHAFLKEELNSAYIYNFDRFIEVSKFIAIIMNII